MPTGGPEMQIKVESKDVGKELSADDNTDIGKINNFLKSVNNDVNVQKILANIDKKNAADRSADARTHGVSGDILLAYDKLASRAKVEFITLPSVDAHLTARGDRDATFRTNLASDFDLQNNIIEGQDAFNRKFMNYNNMEPKDKTRIENFFKNFLGLNERNGSETDFDLNTGSKIKTIITTTEYDKVNRVYTAIPEEQRTAVVHINNVDVSAYANNPSLLQQKLEKAYPGAKINIKQDGATASYSLESIYAYTANKVNGLLDANVGANVERTNSTAAGSFSPEVSANINKVDNLQTKTTIKIATGTINKVDNPGPDKAVNDVIYKKINNLNTKALSSTFDGSVPVDHVPDVTYPTKTKISVPFKEPNDLINEKGILDPSTGLPKKGKFEEVDPDVGYTKDVLGGIRGDIYSITENLKTGENKLNIYALDENSYIDKLISQPTEMEIIRDKLTTRLNTGISDFTALLPLATVEINTPIDRSKIEKDISKLESQLNVITTTVGKFKEFWIPIDGSPNNLAAFARDKHAGKTSRLAALEHYKSTDMARLQQKIADLKNKRDVYDREETNKTNNKNYKDYLNGNLAFKNIIDMGEQAKGEFAKRLVQKAYGVDITTANVGKRNIHQKTKNNDTDITKYISVTKNEQGNIIIKERRMSDNHGAVYPVLYYQNGDNSTKDLFDKAVNEMQNVKTMAE